MGNAEYMGSRKWTAAATSPENIIRRVLKGLCLPFMTVAGYWVGMGSSPMECVANSFVQPCPSLSSRSHHKHNRVARPVKMDGTVKQSFDSQEMIGMIRGADKKDYMTHSEHIVIPPDCGPVLREAGWITRREVASYVLQEGETVTFEPAEAFLGGGGLLATNIQGEEPQWSNRLRRFLARRQRALERDGNRDADDSEETMSSN